jgi:tetratricopeptide (TPR) repeat protein
MAPDKLDATLRELPARLASQPERQSIMQHLKILLGSTQPSLPAVRVLGSLLADAFLFDDATKVYEALAERFPDDPTGPVCLAQLSMQRKSWQGALAHWDEVVARFSGRLTASWLGGRAATLMELRRFDEAENIFRSLARDYNHDWHGLVGLAQLAMLRGFWADALALWDEAFSHFRDQAAPSWYAGRVATLSQLNRLDEAENIVNRLADDFPAHPQGFVGRAEIAVRKGTWHNAVAHWDEVLARFPKMATPYWQIARARALVGVGQADEAETIFRGLMRLNPELLGSFIGLLDVLLAQGKAQEAAFELYSSVFRSSELVVVVDARFRILLMLRRFAEARTEFDRLLKTTNDLGMLNALFINTPAVHTPPQRAPIWVALLQKLENLQGQSKLGSATILALRARVLLALRDYDRFLALISEATERDLGEHRLAFLAIASKLRGQSFPDYAAPKIFGVGLAKTGTSSLSAALTLLGFHTLHSLNPLTREIISADDLPLFDAFTDGAVCGQFEKYYFEYPNSQFIHTVRPFESWKKSMSDHYLRIYGYSEIADLKKALTPFAADVSDNYPKLLFNNNSYEEGFDAYEQHVRHFFQDKPKDRFLKFDVLAGRWEELCAFTGRAIPSSAFPWLNRKP